MGEVECRGRVLLRSMGGGGGQLTVRCEVGQRVASNCRPWAECSSGSRRAQRLWQTLFSQSLRGIPGAHTRIFRREEADVEFHVVPHERPIHDLGQEVLRYLGKSRRNSNILICKPVDVCGFCGDPTLGVEETVELPDDADRKSVV